VLENPNHPDGRKLPIYVAVLPASSGKALSDPIAVLMGGPGEDAISAAEIYAAQFAQLLKDRDLWLVDQRGTGDVAVTAGARILCRYPDQSMPHSKRNRLIIKR
jgi:pimeloyl-ACP methyl ester carboxylesterase